MFGYSNITNKDTVPSFLYIHLQAFFASYKSTYLTSKELYVF